MLQRHTFTINGTAHSFNEMTLLAVIAIVNMPNENGQGYNRRVLAIKQLRSVTGLGLFEAKQIVDFVAEKGRVGNNGEIYMELAPPPVVVYTLGPQ